MKYAVLFNAVLYSVLVSTLEKRYGTLTFLWRLLYLLGSGGKKIIIGFTPVYIFCFNINSEQFLQFTPLLTCVKSYIVIVIYICDLL